MIKVITISGLCFTGKTSFSEKLAALLKWGHIGAGQRFRDYCNTEQISITDIPQHIHLEFDRNIKEDIVNKQNTVIEGHYLGVFSQGITSVLRVLLISDNCKRVERCFFRDRKIIDLNGAEKIILERDEREKKISNDLYNYKNFDDQSLFDEVILNNDLNDFLNGLQKIKQLVQ